MGAELKFGTLAETAQLEQSGMDKGPVNVVRVVRRVYDELTGLRAGVRG